MNMRTLIAATLMTGFFSAQAAAETIIKDAWVRASLGNVKVTAGYATITNTGDSDDELLSVSTASAGMTTLHKTEIVNDVAKMLHVRTLAIPAKGNVVLKPGEYHLMLMNLPRVLKAGDKVELVFTFKKQGQVKVAADVVTTSPNTSGASEDHSHH
jgi:copper(I)-binding protein